MQGKNGWRLNSHTQQRAPLIKRTTITRDPPRSIKSNKAKHISKSNAIDDVGWVDIVRMRKGLHGSSIGNTNCLLYTTVSYGNLFVHI